MKKKQQYTREEVIKIIDSILQHPDQLMDATQNENTNWFGEEFLELVEGNIEEHGKEYYV